MIQIKSNQSFILSIVQQIYTVVHEVGTHTHIITKTKAKPVLLIGNGSELVRKNPR